VRNSSRRTLGHTARTARRIAVFIGIITAAWAPSNASAANVGGCTPWPVNYACVQADMGTKDYVHHRQWVGNVRAYSSWTPWLLEAWGDGFYRSGFGYTSDRTWYIGRWVASGTNICGAYTDYGTPGRPRWIACIAVRV
jgi:hypothetical protein